MIRSNALNGIRSNALNGTRSNALNGTPFARARTGPSREAAQECSPRRQPWVVMQQRPAPKGRQTLAQETAKSFTGDLYIPLREYVLTRICVLRHISIRHD